jgi:hypothetical protein
MRRTAADVEGQPTPIVQHRELDLGLEDVDVGDAPRS